jgi:hypothetical protein
MEYFMSVLASIGHFPNEVVIQCVNFLDARSKASFLTVCTRFRGIMANDMGLSPSMLGFAAYLTDELVIAGLYNRALASKNAVEGEMFKSGVGDMWFEALSGKSVIPAHLLTFAICDLSAKRTWSDVKIKKLCQTLNYEAKKEMPDVPCSWKVVLKS